MTGTIQDITENQRIEANLDEVNQRYQRLANNAPDIIFRYGLFPTMHLEYINPVVETITGYSPEECYADPD